MGNENVIFVNVSLLSVIAGREHDGDSETSQPTLRHLPHRLGDFLRPVIPAPSKQPRTGCSLMPFGNCSGWTEALFQRATQLPKIVHPRSWFNLQSLDCHIEIVLREARQNGNVKWTGHTNSGPLRPGTHMRLNAALRRAVTSVPQMTPNRASAVPHHAHPHPHDG